MNDKDQTLECLASEVLHENNPSTYNTLDNKNIHPITCSTKRPLISSSSGERKSSKHIIR